MLGIFRCLITSFVETKEVITSIIVFIIIRFGLVCMLVVISVILKEGEDDFLADYCK